MRTNLKRGAPSVRPAAALRGHGSSAVLHGLAVLFLCGCGAEPQQDPPTPFVYTPPPPPKATRVPEATFEWLQMVESMRQQLADLEATVQERQAIHQQNSFDDFLQADLSQLTCDQLAYLWHFADKGYFTVEREILVRLLEDRLGQPEESLQDASGIAERAKRLALNYEQRLRDLKTAVELYEKTQRGDFHVPAILTEDQLAVLRDLVREKLDGAKSQISALDTRIAELNAERKSQTP